MPDQAARECRRVNVSLSRGPLPKTNGHPPSPLIDPGWCSPSRRPASGWCHFWCHELLSVGLRWSLSVADHKTRIPAHKAAIHAMQRYRARLADTALGGFRV
jgi:hypothetical protein